MRLPLDAPTIRRRGAVLTALALAMVLAATLLPSVANAHGDLNENPVYHATAVAEGGSTLFVYDPPGPDPTQEYWLDCLASIKHRVDENGNDWYKPTFKCTSWKGVFSDDDSIWAAPGDAQPVELSIRMFLYSLDPNTGILTPLVSTGFRTDGSQLNGYSLGCWGDGHTEVQIGPDFEKKLVTRLYVKGNRRYYFNGHWYNAPAQTTGWHVTSSHQMGLWYFDTIPASAGHNYYDDPLANYFINTSNPPAYAVFGGFCPLGQVPPEPYQ